MTTGCQGKKFLCILQHSTLKLCTTNMDFHYLKGGRTKLESSVIYDVQQSHISHSLLHQLISWKSKYNFTWFPCYFTFYNKLHDAAQFSMIFLYHHTHNFGLFNEWCYSYSHLRISHDHCTGIINGNKLSCGDRRMDSNGVIY